MAPLTARQAEVLRYIEDYISDHGFPPSGRELSQACGLGSPSGAHRMLVLLESKGYLTRKRGLSRGVSVMAQPISTSSGLREQDNVILLTLATWHAAARDAELTMATRAEDIEGKSALIESARDRHRQFCFLMRAIPGSEGAAVTDRSEIRALRATDDLIALLPRCDSWELFVIDELVCDRAWDRIIDYALCSRPEVRGLLWRQERLSEQTLTRSRRWTREVLDSLQGDAQASALSSNARRLSEVLYTAGQAVDNWSNEGSPLFTTFDPEEAASLAVGI